MNANKLLIKLSLLVVPMVTFATVAAANVNSSEQLEAYQQLADERTQAYRADYQLLRRGRQHGVASRELTKDGEAGWVYRTETEASILFFSDRRSNTTWFVLDHGLVQPQQFDYQRRGTGSNQDFHVRFDHANQRLENRGGDELTAEWHESLLDSNAVLHQLQIDVSGPNDEWTYQVLDEDGRNASYTFARGEQEILDLPLGKVQAIKVARVRESNRRETYFWFAPELNYTLVKMQQIKEGKEQAQLQLTEIQFGN